MGVKTKVDVQTDLVIELCSNSQMNILHIAVGDIAILLPIWTCYQGNCHNEIFEVILKGWLHFGGTKNDMHSL